MMTLKQAARFFDKTLFTDVYGTATFYGQLLPFSDSVRSGAATRRRILETGAATVVPTNRTVMSDSGIIYLMANGSEDMYNGGVIRVKYPVLPVDYVFQIRTIGQLLAGSGGVTNAYMQPSYIRRNLLDESSEYLGAYHIYHSSYYSIHQGDVLYGGSRYYRAKENSLIDDIGLGVVEAIEIDSPIQTLTHVSIGALNEETDTYTETPTNNVTCFVEYSVLDFVHEALGFVPLKSGDKAISFLKTQVAATKVGDRIGVYKIMSVTDNTTFWTVLGRI